MESQHTEGNEAKSSGVRAVADLGAADLPAVIEMDLNKLALSKPYSSV